MWGFIFGMGGVWVFRSILLRMLRVRHPSVFFSHLGAPRLGQLASRSLSRPKLNLQWRFLKFVWGGEFLRLRDPVITTVGAASFICDVGTLGLLVLLVSGGAR